VQQDRAIEVYFNSFGDSAITFTLRFWIDFSTPADFPKAKDKAVQAIKSAFEGTDIDMPFPIRTIKFDDNTDPNQQNQPQ
jgi:small conductance mechanosensitive channel